MKKNQQNNSITNKKQILLGILIGLALSVVLWISGLFAGSTSMIITLIFVIILYFVLYNYEHKHPDTSFVPFKVAVVVPFTISFVTQVVYLSRFV